MKKSALLLTMFALVLSIVSVQRTRGENAPPGTYQFTTCHTDVAFDSKVPVMNYEAPQALGEAEIYLPAIDNQIVSPQVPQSLGSPGEKHARRVWVPHSKS